MIIAEVIDFMHFRFRGNNIQVVQSRPDPESGKAKSIPVGSINRATLEITDKLRRECSAEQIAEIEAWVKRRRGVDELKQQHAVATLPEQLALAAQWFRRASPEEARGAADDIVSTYAMLRKVLSKRELI